ncbi:hypothetical protein BG015_006202 [Linnemannia schmuckeri]|uniref:AAA+ ATPase domain-containing protein n=1 Tax=Linnemannia schmuckeri TaxID=64567 RepID=A0A9P5S2B3_9FUNG|nr:hypothetical protein BG015_006202 [Linnemannia schmuckeri]
MADAAVPPATTTTVQTTQSDHSQQPSSDTQLAHTTSMAAALTSDPEWADPSPSTTDATILQASNESTPDSHFQDADAAMTPASEPAEETQHQQLETEPTSAVTAAPAATTSAAAAPPKQVFSLFLTPEQRKKKQETEATVKVPGKRGRKPKNKLPVGQVGMSLVAGSTTAPGSVTSTSTTTTPKSIVDPNISKTGETHRFFQEVKNSQLSAAGAGPTSSELNSDGTAPRVVRRYNYKPQDKLASKNNSSHGWYSLRTDMDLGITAPDYKPSPRGKDCWTHWGNSRDLKWRDWSEQSHRSSRLTAKEKMILSQPSEPDEFESCRRVGSNERLWHQTWATTLLSTAGIEPGSVDAPGDLKYGELWTEKYRPNQGAEVLGNRVNTQYLTRWLKRLEVSGWTLNPEESSAGGGGGGGGGGSGSAGSGKKGSDIMGAARKRRKRAKRKDMNDLNDFIAYDDLDDFEEPYGYQSDEEGIEFKAHKPLTSFSLLASLDFRDEEYGSTIAGSRALSKKFDIKSNTILLSGPTGSCKTAAVYACAEESGYEVFEVSPGMRRTGKEVLGLVGEMAENHHVHVVPGKTELKEDIHSIMSGKNQGSPAPAPTPAPKNSTLHSFFQQNKKIVQENEDEIMEEAVSDSSEPEDEDMIVDWLDEDDSQVAQSPDTQQTRSSPSSTSTPSAVKEPDEGHQDQGESLAHHEDTLSDLYSLLSTTNPRQSLILLEEVDILFEDDKGFWASIVALLSKSRRPVVMTCNDTSKIPASMIRFQEHLEFTRPGMRELHLYLMAVCRIEGYICSSEYVMGVIKQNRYDVRRCLMQLQYDSGVVKHRSQLFKSGSSSSPGSSRGSSPVVAESSGVGIVTPTTNGGRVPQSDSGRSSPTPGSPMRKKPQRLMRISAKSIIPATAPTLGGERKKALPSPMQELEQLEVQLQYADTMSLSDSCLRMRSDRILQCFEADQFAASKDDVVGQYFPIFKRPSGTDHLFMDQEIAALVEEGCESLYLNLCSQQELDAVHVFDTATSRMDPVESMAENFVPKNNDMSRILLHMRPALEETLPVHGLRFNLGVTFGTYAPMIRSMIQADVVNTAVPTGKRTMRSGGHLRRHMNMLSDDESQAMLLTCFPSTTTITTNTVASTSPSPSPSPLQSS